MSVLALLRMSPWLAILLLLGAVTYQSGQIHKWHVQSERLSERLRDISNTKNEQKVETKTRIETVTRTIHDADGRAKAVEQAPLPGNCGTPQEVLNADL